MSSVETDAQVGKKLPHEQLAKKLEEGAEIVKGVYR
jgi:hypothetical protein